VLIVWRLDRLGPNLWHLVVTLEELSAHGIGVVSVNEGINATTPAGRLQTAVLGAIAQFEEKESQRGYAPVSRGKKRRASGSDADRTESARTISDA
jgi:DNA invertase Pin-like site-specific DNA recombinase